MKSIIFSLVVAVGILYTASYLTRNPLSLPDSSRGNTAGSLSGEIKNDNQNTANNVTVVDGKQIITITVRGGYSPKVSVAKAGLPTTIRFKTNNTFDCSSAVRIPSLSVSKSLPSTGETDIDLGTQNVGTLKGSCSMGMYNFSVKFEG